MMSPSVIIKETANKQKIIMPIILMTFGNFFTTAVIMFNIITVTISNKPNKPKRKIKKSNLLHCNFRFDHQIIAAPDLL